MKKFIATLLSALVGVFGYTLTDSVVEDRISKLETEIVELREQIAINDNIYGQYEPPEVGDYIKIISNPRDKFLFRENNEGEFIFIHPAKVNEILSDDIFINLTDISCKLTSK